MDYSASFQISASAMAVEKLRLDVSVANLANIHTAAASAATVYQPLRVVSKSVPMVFSQGAFGTQFGQLMLQEGGGVAVQNVVSVNVPPRLVYEPGHPQADDKGYVTYPGINHTSEMVNVLAALRAYEANVVALGAAKTMAARTLEIGGQQ